MQADITLDWPTWAQTAYRSWYIGEPFDDPPRIEIEIVLRVQRLAEAPDPSVVLAVLPEVSPPIGTERLERSGPTIETVCSADLDEPEYAIEVSLRGQLRPRRGDPGRRHDPRRPPQRHGRLDRVDPGASSATSRFPSWPRSTTTTSFGPMAEVLDIEVADRVATVTLNRPEARNALDRELRGALQSGMAALDAEAGVDVVILTGTDPAFCAGLDLKELGAEGRSADDALAARAETPPWSGGRSPGCPSP